MVPEDRQEPATLSSPRTHSNELLDDRVRHLSFDEALRLAKERLELLPFEEILRLFGQEVKEIPLGNILQVAGERLTKLSFESVLRLAAERLEGIQVSLLIVGSRLLSSKHNKGSRQEFSDHQVRGPGGRTFGASSEHQTARGGAAIGACLQAPTNPGPQGCN